MIHIATTHYHTDRWIGVQRRYIERHTPEPYRIYACLGGVARSNLGRFDFATFRHASLGDKLNYLAARILAEAGDDDLLVFLDGDAFPIAAWTAAMRGWLDGTPIAAVRRDENVGDPQPHQLFCVTTPRFWDEIDGDWSPGPTWTTRTGERATDHGAVLWRRLEELGIRWHPILRSNTRDLHPLWFAVYGNVVYHHGAAFRKPMSRVDAATVPPKRGLNRVRRFVQLELRARRMKTLGEEIFDRLNGDEGFYRELVA